MHNPTSPRLPGVPILRLNATGAEYSRWRRSLKFALETKGTWKYCSGEATMPMPEVGSSSKHRDQETSTPQPSLLEERKAWVRQDREVKLDMYLSLTEEVMLELFTVGPPLPPSNLSALELLEALDERFTSFKFEAYHHAFCHFLNLHVEQYATVADFNIEFWTTLEDLVDYGHPLSNIQACSAYLSKLRCTKNTWVLNRLEEWDTQTSEPQLTDLMSELLLWESARPFSYTLSHTRHTESIADETYGSGSAHSSIGAAFKSPYSTSIISGSSHSRNTSANTTASRVGSTAESLRDVIEPESSNIHRSSPKLPVMAILQRRSARKGTVPAKSMLELHLPDRQTGSELTGNSRSRSASPRLCGVMHSNPLKHELEDSTLGTYLPALVSSNVCSTPRPAVSYETLRSQLRSQLLGTFSAPPLSEHPAFRTAPPASDENQTSDDTQKSTPENSLPVSTLSPSFTSSSPPLKPDCNASSPNLIRPHCPQTDVLQRPHPSCLDLLSAQEHTHPPRQPTTTALPVSDADCPNLYPPHPSSSSSSSASSSIINLPLQGVQSSSWDYLHNATRLTMGGTMSAHSVSPVQSLSASESFTALPQMLATQTRTFEDFTDPEPNGATDDSGNKRKNLDMKRKKKGWNVGVNLSRFSYSKGVKERI